MTRARAVDLPANSLLASRYAKADLADAFAIDLPDATGSDIAELARTVLSRPPFWILGLMACRDRIMRTVGVKSAADLREEGLLQPHGVVGSFPIRQQTEREIVMGADDRHLNFFTSMMVDETSQPRQLVWVTVVDCRNRLGRFYLRTISPFHRLIVPAFLDRAAERQWR